MHIDDEEFDKLLTKALYRAAELDYYLPPADELDRIIQPSPEFQRRMEELFRGSK